MKQAASLKNVPTDLALPGIVANTSPTDYRVNKQMQMMKFDGERWELFGPIIEDTGAWRARPGDPIETIGGKKRSAALRDRRFLLISHGGQRREATCRPSR